MFVLGITGLYCSGKSVASKYLSDKGFIEIDVDKLGHEALEAKRDEITDLFGDFILDENGEINRKTLGRVVFNDEGALLKLEKVVHPYMKIRVGELLNELSDQKYILINAAILHKIGLENYCNRILAITSPDDVIIKRGAVRDNLGEEEVLKRLKKQKLYNENFRSADYFIENTDDFQKFINDLDGVYADIREKQNGK
jgi:dephospho-CoA kinase